MKIRAITIISLITLSFAGTSAAANNMDILRNFALSSRQMNVTVSTFLLRISQEEGLRTAEYGDISSTAYWIAVETGTGTFTTNKYEFAFHPTLLDHNFQTYNFQQSFSTTPVFISHMNTHYGRDTASIRYRNLSTGSVELMVQEEQSLEDEMEHTYAETMCHMIAEPGSITAGGSVIGEIGTVTVSSQKDQWHPLTLNNTYINPILVMCTLSYNDTTPVTVVVNNNDGRFYFQLTEWEYLDKIHGEETISYVVIEKGEHVLDNGSMIKAGTGEANMIGLDDARFDLEYWAPHAFPSSFNRIPLMFSAPVFFMPYDAQVEMTGNTSIREDESISFVVTRDTDVGSGTMLYETEGTAVNGVDYQTLSGTITFTNGQSSATVVITPIQNSLMNIEKTIGIHFYFLSRKLILDLLLLDDDIHNNEFIQNPGNIEIFCGENGYIDMSNSSDRAEIVINPAQSGNIKIKLYDLVGTLIWSEIIYVEAGTKKIIIWDPNNSRGVTSGIYFFYINGAGIKSKKKVAVIR